MRYRSALVPLVGAMVLTAGVAAQMSEPVNGMRPADLRLHAIEGATIVVSPERTIENATIVIRDGIIVSVGDGVAVPPQARRWSGDGLTIYPGFIDAAVMMGIEELPSGAGAHWNSNIHPQVRIADQAVLESSTRKQLRGSGITAAAVYPSSGIWRGTGMVIATAEDDEHALAYREDAMMAAGFDRGGGYPGSLMGAIALCRQTLFDAQWHAVCRDVWSSRPRGNEPPVRADALLALADAIRGEQPVLFDVSDALNALRAARVAEEFGLDLVLLGSGLEFQTLDEVVATGHPIVLPMNYPEAPKASTLPEAEDVTLRTLMTWEQAPTNPRRLVDAGVPIALTTHRLPAKSHFLAHVRKAVQHGLTEDAALAALTTTPATLLGLDDVMGTLEPGKVANLVIVEGSIFESSPKPVVRTVWINGRRHEIDEPETLQLAGRGRLVTSEGLDVPITIDTEKKKISLEVDGETVRASGVTFERDRLTFVVDGEPFDADGRVQLGGVITGETVVGMGRRPGGARFSFDITDVEAIAEEKPADDEIEIAAADEPVGHDDVSGEWTSEVTASDMPMEDNAFTIMLELSDDGESVSGAVESPFFTAPLQGGSYDAESGELRATIASDEFNSELRITIADDAFTGVVDAGGDMTLRIEGERTAMITRGDDGDDDVEDFVMPPDELVYPLGAYGLTERPATQDVMITNATIWTSGPQGIVENGTMVVRGGRVVGVYAAGARIEGDRPELLLDLEGRHVSPGLIDCHSHTGISSGVNEGGQTVTSEVRIGDVVNPDDINWYRQLAGGLTAANQLHGSANPIGGQNSVVKLRWGQGPDAFRVEDSKPGIKFALGENVVRRETRYPNTRMGVETMISDAFTAAREYEAARATFASRADAASGYPPPRDLELDALVEILNGDRIIHCHSYRQDEILMLIRIADSFGFTIGTFQHVLEGYKVADAIAEHGAGASSFSDWWAYKIEVMDAIPYNGALMTDIGVTVSFNSDSSELARRMNTEAAKAVRYGGLDPAEALKLVTLNPAIQMGIGHRTGSLEPGKDADFVVWSGDPLSTLSRCEQTWIEGARHFDLETDLAMRETAGAERERLMQKLLASGGKSKSRGESGDAKPAPARERRGVMAWQEGWVEEQLRLGLDPTEIRRGECAGEERLQEGNR